MRSWNKLRVLASLTAIVLFALINARYDLDTQFMASINQFSADLLGTNSGIKTTYLTNDVKLPATAEQAASSGTQSNLNYALENISLGEVSTGSGEVNLNLGLNQKISTGNVIAAKVDAAGNGDYLTISDALKQVKEGIIAVGPGTYSEDQLVIPAGVTLKGGSDPESWAQNLEQYQTFIKPSSSGVNFIVQLGGAGAIVDGIIIEGNGNTCVKNNYTGGRVLRSVMHQCQIGLELGENSFTEVSNNIFYNCDVAVYAKDNAKADLNDNQITGGQIGILNQTAS